MIYTLISWMIIGASAFLWGFGILVIIEKVNHYRIKDLDLIIMTGICALTVYAQVFSLFYRVGVVALAGVFLFDALCLVLMRKDILCLIKNKRKSGFFHCLLVTAFIGFTLIIITASSPVVLDDTYSYHAQTIRWIEEYGIVPGLGNLHGRLAFNSSFLCLQALFSFHDIIGLSMHGMNGFIMWIILSYAICSVKLWRKKKVCTSDFVRIALVSYYLRVLNIVSSPGTDIPTMGLIGYIVCKWIDLLEEDRKNIAPYAYLCILSVGVATFKLSSAMIVFLSIMPAYWLVIKRKWKEIALYIGLGILIIAPFLVRNVILSGYLIYPYPKIDLFSFDWKIPAADAEYMQRAVTVYAQGGKGIYEIVPLKEWFPVWKDNCLRTDLIMLLELIADIMAAPAALIIGTIMGLRKKDWNFFHVMACLTVGIVFWFFNAPTRRFGEMYLILLPVCLVGSILENIKFRAAALRLSISAFIVISGYCTFNLIRFAVIYADKSYVITCADYDICDCKPFDIGGLTVYYANPEIRRAGYHYFPSIPEESMLSGVELRGDSFADGFRSGIID